MRLAAASRITLLAFSLAALGAGTARALTTTYLPVLLERIDDAPSLIGVVMTVNAVSGLLVPLAVGVWSDRRAAGGLGRRLPYMAGGAVLGAGGLVAIGLGNGSSYLALGLAAAVVYTGLNALTTAHRALVAEDVADERRPATTSAQELAMTAGAAVAVGIGGALIEPAPAVAFAIAAGVLLVAAVPTLIVTRRLRLGGSAAPRQRRSARASLGAVLRRPGAREVLLAQTLWVLAYAALPAFFILYAEEALELDVGIAGALPLAFGAFVALGMVLAGRARPERVHGLLVTGAALLGAGLMAAALTSRLATAALPLATAGFGAGLLTALGFAYFARFVPEGEAGSYSGVFFAGRGVAAAIALPLAGVAVELTGSYRTVLWLGAAAVVALVPLIVAESRRSGVVALRPRPATVAAVMPVFASEPGRRDRPGHAAPRRQARPGRRRGAARDRTLARSPDGGRARRAAHARAQRRQGQRRRGRGAARAAGVGAAGGDPGARLRRSARSRAHPGVRRGGALGRRRDRVAPRPSLDAARAARRKPGGEPGPGRRLACLDSGHAERNAPVPHRGAIGRRAAGGGLRGGESAPARPARRRAPGRVGRDPDRVRRASPVTSAPSGTPFRSGGRCSHLCPPARRSRPPSPCRCCASGRRGWRR